MASMRVVQSVYELKPLVLAAALASFFYLTLLANSMSIFSYSALFTLCILMNSIIFLAALLAMKN
jgi:hypothetical protein